MKYFVIILFTSFPFAAKSQTNIYPASGNVGLGTLNPLSELQVNDGYQKITLGKLNPAIGQTLGWASQYIGLNLARNSQGWLANGDGGHNGGAMFLGDTFGQLRIVNIPSTGTYDQLLSETQINTNTRFFVGSNGNVGVGTVSPAGKVHIQGIGSSVNGGNSAVVSGDLIIQSNTGGRNITTGAQLEFVIPANTDGGNLWGQGRIITVAGNTSNSNATGKMILGTRRAYDKLGAGTQWYYGDDMTIDGSGNVGIGTINPTQKLTVKGTVYSTEVKVDINAGTGPDYVFEPTYTLPSLDSVQSYINQNKHLPEIPSAKEMEANGVNLGEMNMLLLKKVEELTLYMIEQNKKMQLQQNEMENQRKEMGFLKQQIDSLKSKK